MRPARVREQRTLRQRLRDMWALMRGRVPEYAEGDEPPRRRRRGGPPGEKALVSAGPPKKPLPSSAVALLPEPEIRDVEAIGRDPDEDEPGDHALASR